MSRWWSGDPSGLLPVFTSSVNLPGIQGKSVFTVLLDLLGRLDLQLPTKGLSTAYIGRCHLVSVGKEGKGMERPSA